MSHEPEIAYLCHDYRCCPDGCPIVFCHGCTNRWPCAYRVENDPITVTHESIRWVARVQGTMPRPDGHYRPRRMFT